MRIRFLLLILTLSVLSINAQKLPVDSLLEFKTNFYDCENKWVVIPKKADSDRYGFGFIYLDGQAGITIDIEGTFKIDSTQKFVRLDNRPKTSSIKHRLGKNTVLFALLSPSQLEELGLPHEPDWLKYYLISDKLTHDIAFGRNLNAIGECEAALKYLENSYKVSPHAEGLEFELSFSYNALRRYDDALKVLELALKNNPKNTMFFRELGYSQMNKGDFDNAVKTYKNGIKLCSDSQNAERSEMAYNMALIYQQHLKNDEQFKYWGNKAKSWTNENTQIYKSLIKLGF